MSGYSTYDTDQPWVCYHYGLTHDLWWPLWSSTRVIGRARIRCECAVCGCSEVVTIKMPRFGPIPQPTGGRHQRRIQFLLEHLHADRPHPMSWAKPLLNPAAHTEGIDFGLLAMRLDADLNEGKRL